MTFRKLAFVPLALGLAACTVGPDYTAPSATLATSFAEGGAAPIGDAAAQYWWRGYNDRLLSDLVQQGLGQNLDIKTAISRVRQAQAAARATGAPALVSGNLSGGRTVSGSETVDNAGVDAASFSPALVLDLFGGERRNREAALAALASAQLSVGEARLAYLASIVSNYIDLRYYQNALAILRQTIGTRRETLSLVQSQREAGAATALDEAQAQAALDEALASLPGYESGFYAASYAIATLLAVPAQTIEDRLERGAAQPYVNGSADVGIPADLLRNRPDVRAAERDFAEAVANVGVAAADLYPSVTLSGSIGDTEGFKSWSYGPQISIPVLNRPLLQAQRDAAVAAAQTAELAWRASVLDAVEGVQSAQSDYIRNRRAVSAYRRSVSSYERVVSLSRETYNGGTTTLLDFLDVQRLLASSRLTLASSLRDLAASWATLQVAAGKGWTVPAAAAND
ncbi:nodulation protein T precursor [Salipiger aestuarii]|nr:efflux transporter outer membrane subunit [Salipiger aestuarii]EIE50598.1 RND efflux system outer membrane lipoprotein [Citreicella sp. 357]KAA8606269.1 nodulation protein T precursor [Salipiger aestuarii]KAA8609374.1 nodulation protein T precursor [Salipiger aestuarii]KAB2540922.1 nodulation protein T precursor [Salipiger aestuarii]